VKKLENNGVYFLIDDADQLLGGMHETGRLFVSPQRGRREKWGVKLVKSKDDGDVVRCAANF
jgi:hypothetical protein